MIDYAQFPGSGGFPGCLKRARIRGQGAWPRSARAFLIKRRHWL